MTRDIRRSEKLLLGGLCFIIVFMVVQDWVPLGSLNDVDAIAKSRSTSELIIVTMTGTLQFLLIFAGVLFFMGKRYPTIVKIWLIIHQSSIFVGALIAWWIPYLFGIGAEKRAEDYQIMFGGTHSFLPVMNGIVPNTLHTMFHGVLLMCIILTIYISFSSSKNKGHPPALKVINK